MAETSSHTDDHDDPEELQLVTESARVIDVTALDENRTEEIRPVAARLLGEPGRGDLVTDETPVELDWHDETHYVQEPLVRYLADDVETDLGVAVAAVRSEPSATDIEARVNPANLEVYACGLSAMTERLVGVVERIGVPSEHVHGESYG